MFSLTLLVKYSETSEIIHFSLVLVWGCFTDVYQVQVCSVNTVFFELNLVCCRLDGYKLFAESGLKQF